MSEMKFQLQARTSESDWQFVDGGSSVAWLVIQTTRSRFSDIQKYNLDWRIVRTSDNVVIAQKYVKVQS